MGVAVGCWRSIQQVGYIIPPGICPSSSCYSVWGNVPIICMYVNEPHTTCSLWKILYWKFQVRCQLKSSTCTMFDMFPTAPGCPQHLINPRHICARGL